MNGVMDMMEKDGQTTATLNINGHKLEKSNKWAVKALKRLSELYLGKIVR